jgi:hypothetical protein
MLQAGPQAQGGSPNAWSQLAFGGGRVKSFSLTAALTELKEIPGSLFLTLFLSSQE